MIDQDSVDGLMLGDASIHPKRDMFSFAQAGIYREPFVQRVYNMLSRSGFDPRYNAVTRKSDGVYVVTTWTVSSGFWADQRKRFYPLGRKVIPADILISPRSMLMEYLCDGSIGWAHGPPWSVGSCPWIELAVCGYLVPDIDVFGSKLIAALGIDKYSIKTPQKYPKLYIGSRERTRKFFEYIMSGEQIPSGYEYKFRGFMI